MSSTLLSSRRQNGLYKASGTQGRLSFAAVKVFGSMIVGWFQVQNVLGIEHKSLFWDQEEGPRISFAQPSHLT